MSVRPTDCLLYLPDCMSVCLSIISVCLPVCLSVCVPVTTLSLPGDEEDVGLQEQLFVTVMELLHTILWRYFEKLEALGKQQIGRILLTIDDLDGKLFKSTSAIKMRLFELVIHSMNLVNKSFTPLQSYCHIKACNDVMS